MPPPPRSRARRDRRGGDPEERFQRARESQQAAYETSRAVLAVAAARRDADWRESAQANRRRALIAVIAPVAVGVLLIVIGAFVLPVLIAGIAVTLLWVVMALRFWRRPGSGLLRALDGIAGTDAVARGIISPAEAERLVGVTEGLCAALGLPVPGLQFIEGSIPNALSLGGGPDDATLIVTVGTLRALDRIELEAVLAHELVHVKRLDVLTAGIAATSLGTAADGLSGGRFSAWLDGDDREIRADLAAVSATRYPPGLISALERIAALRRNAGASGSDSSLSDARTRRRVEMSWLVPAAASSDRLGRRRESELADRLDVLREL